MTKHVITRSMLIAASDIEATFTSAKFSIYGIEQELYFRLVQGTHDSETNIEINFGIESIKTPKENQLNLGLYVVGMLIQNPRTSKEDKDLLKSFYDLLKVLLKKA